LTSLFFIGLVEACVDVQQKRVSGRIGLQWCLVWWTDWSLVTRWVYSELSCTHRNHCHEL